MPLDIPEKFLAQVQAAWLEGAKHVTEEGGYYEFSVKIFRQEKNAPLQTVIACSITKQYRS